MTTSDAALERHYNVSEVAKIWQVSVATVYRLVINEPDVLRMTGPSGKTSYRIPESVVRRIHTRLITPKKRLKIIAQ